MHLTHEETELTKTREEKHQLFFALLLIHYKRTLNFNFDSELILPAASLELSEYLSIPNRLEKPSERSLKSYRQVIRKHFNTRQASRDHQEMLKCWLTNELIPNNYLKYEEIVDHAKAYLQNNRIESLAPKVMERLTRSANKNYKLQLFEKISEAIGLDAKGYLNGLMLPHPNLSGISYFGWLGRLEQKPSLASILELLEKLEFINSIKIDNNIFVEIPRKRVREYASNISRHNPTNIKTMPEKSRYAQLSLYVFIKQQEIIDQTIDIFSKISHYVVYKSERKVVKKLIDTIKKISGKENLLCDIAEACIESPDKSIRETIFPIADESKLNDVISDIRRKGKIYQKELQTKIKNSYSNHYRRMTKPLLDNLTFHCTNPSHRSLIQALEIIKCYFNSSTKYLPKDLEIPTAFIPEKWQPRIIDSENERVLRIPYEVYTLKRLSELLQCREIWVDFAFKYRNPDSDIPDNFNTNKQLPYDLLSLDKDANNFIANLKSQHSQALSEFNNQVPKNKYVKLLNRKGGWIKLTPLEAQEESQNLKQIKEQLAKQWSSICLIDAFKEVELRLNLTKHFISQGERIYLKPRELSERLLLAIYGIGTNAGIKTMCVGNENVSYKKLQHVQQYFLSESNIKDAIGRVANELFNVRNSEIWGEMPVAVGSDSTQFSAYFQNLISEYHNRYGGRGVMIYWHVEKNAICIHSQLKSVSSSEVPAMIIGVLKHCTEMSVQKNYVDTHGQSEVGFAFAHLLGFELMPRFANLGKQKLSQCELGDYQKYTNLQNILTDTINWDLIRSEYPQMVKYAAAMQEGYTDPETLLKRFNRNNSSHPTYKALSQLGKVIKTIFLCNYLMNKSIRREVQEGLNVVELWNGVSKFIFYGRKGEIATNNPSSQTLSVLCLHLIQLSMVYINTLLLQEIIIKNDWLAKLTPEDKRSITPLIYEHINPYGLFPIDLDKRIDISFLQEAA
ncbi:Tn3 family transposase [Thiotrichales bacterium 19S11-10]|nr:Tn3 family transposase [Thiotrichales bacterium 19S11-10]